MPGSGPAGVEQVKLWRRPNRWAQRANERDASFEKRSSVRRLPEDPPAACAPIREMRSRD